MTKTFTCQPIIALSVASGLSLLACAPDPDPAAEANVAASTQVLVGRLAAHWEDGPFVVLLTPEQPVEQAESLGTAVMDQYGVAFIPNVLVARVDQPVEFRNSEEIEHNVLASSMDTGDAIFNVSTPRGDPYTHTFDMAGGYAIICDIHPGMTAVLVVTDAPYHAVVEPDGRYRMDGVPEGSYRVALWNADVALRAASNVTVGAGSTELNLP